MTEKTRQDKFSEGMPRIGRVGHQLGDMFGQGRAAALREREA